MLQGEEQLVPKKDATKVAEKRGVRAEELEAQRKAMADAHAKEL